MHLSHIDREEAVKKNQTPTGPAEVASEVASEAPSEDATPNLLHSEKEEIGKSQKSKNEPPLQQKEVPGKHSPQKELSGKQTYN